MNILEQIVQQKRIEVAQRRASMSARELEQHPSFKRTPLSARQSITATHSTGIIAEFKRKSPSKGIINASVSVTETTMGYVRAGAACLSVLTDEPYFGGTPNDLLEAREVNPTTPILRKDFIIDPYQLLEAKAWGADLILLIAACLSPEEVSSLSCTAHDLGLEVLLEVHDEDELDRTLTDTVDLVGVNNRNLKTFVTSVDTSLRLAERIPDAFVRVTESGLQDAATMLMLREAGYQGFLIGEAFMRTPSPADALAGLVAEFIRQTPSFTNNHTR